MQNALLKIKRAKQHIADFESKLQAFKAANPYRLVVESNDEANGFSLVFRILKSAPSDLPAIVGDAVHNLRVALDVLIYGIVVKNFPEASPGQARRIQFPFSETADALERTINDRHICRAGKQVTDEIIRLKPYKGASGDGGGLYALHELDIADKHRLFIDLDRVSIIPDFTLLNALGDRIVNMTNVGMGAKEGMTFLHIEQPVRDVKINHYINPSPEIIFSRMQPFGGKAVTPTLVQLTQLVEQTIAAIARAAGNI